MKIPECSLDSGTNTRKSLNLLNLARLTERGCTSAKNIVLLGHPNFSFFFLLF